jgi:hypothetical protein
LIRQPVSVFAGDKKSMGQAELEVWPIALRNLRAKKALAICWGISFATLFLPLVHFFLVPGFLILGPFVYKYIKKQSGLIINVEAGCPFCSKKLQLPKSQLEWPLRAVCQSCFEPLRIESTELP